MFGCLATYLPLHQLSWIIWETHRHRPNLAGLPVKYSDHPDIKEMRDKVPSRKIGDLPDYSQISTSIKSFTPSHVLEQSQMVTWKWQVVCLSQAYI